MRERNRTEGAGIPGARTSPGGLALGKRPLRAGSLVDTSGRLGEGKDGKKQPPLPRASRCTAMHASPEGELEMFWAQRQRTLGAQSLGCNTSSTPLGRDHWDDLTPFAKPRTARPFVLCQRHWPKKVGWGKKFFLLRQGKEMETTPSVGRLAVTPDSWMSGDSLRSLSLSHRLELAGAKYAGSLVLRPAVLCSPWNCCPRTNLDLTLPQDDSFAQLPTLLIPLPFPVLPDHFSLGPLKVIRLSIFMEEGDLHRSELKLGWWELGKNLLRLRPKTLLEPLPLQHCPEVDPGLGVRDSKKPTRCL